MKVFLGWVVFITLWSLVSYFELVNIYILPSPLKIINSFINLIEEGRFFNNVWFSVKINLVGYIIAIIISIPLGFILGLFKNVREMFSSLIDSLRFIPIPALSGLFIVVFGLSIWTKINFLAFAIILYLIPVIVVRLDEVSLISMQMVKTLGASKWQTFKYVQFPSVMSRLSDDIRILVGISWSYLVIAELKSIQGGIGSLIFLGERQSNSGQVYACLITIIIIGVLQDQLFKLIDKSIFKYKYI